MRIVLAVLILSICSGCASTAKVRGAEGSSISKLMALSAYDRPRIAIAPVIDKSGIDHDYSLSWQLNSLGVANLKDPSIGSPAAVAAGIHDMLIQSFFATDQFTLVEREDLDSVFAEHALNESGRVGTFAEIPKGLLEGADLLVLTAITGFDAGAAGAGGFPIPLPVNSHGGFAILNVQSKKGFASMDVRVVDAKTGRVVATAAVEGSDRDYGFSLGYIDISSKWGDIALPNVMTLFKNTPIEQALNKMVDKAVKHIVYGE
ncbi:MAG: curli biogenesis system outer membrane secretion channel CsgG [Pseudoalteromonas tetraodonis]|jgi:curli biogenesis system outer membrane secretion channel CsgG